MMTACGGGRAGGKTAPDAGDAGREAAAEAGPGDGARDAVAEPSDETRATPGPDAAFDVIADATVEGPGDADASAPCVPVSDAHFFVDPIDGRDDPTHTGASGCALRTIKAALGIIKASGVAVSTPMDAAVPVLTITIVNTKGVPTLDASTGEDVGFAVPAGVTIEAQDRRAPRRSSC